MRSGRPTSLDEAVEICSAGEATVIAGGTDVMVDINLNGVRPEGLLDVSRVPELCDWRREGGEIRMGAGMTLTRCLEQCEPSVALAQACRTVGSRPIRNRATIGGNVVTASPAGDLLPFLVAVHAVAVLASGTRGVRQALVADLLLGPRATGIEADEILVRGPNVFAGYFDAEEATARALRDGWLYTGDHGKLDADGNLYVLGRQRAMIKRGGVALAPRELEEAAQSVAGVRVAAAVGVPSELTEEIVVVIEAEGDPSSIEIAVAAAVERAIGFAPDRVLVQAPRTIARTANGKIRHAVLRDQLTPSRLRNNPSVTSDGSRSR